MNNAVREMLEAIARQSLPPEAFEWLSQRANEAANGGSASLLNTTFVLLPRKTGHGSLVVSAEQQKAISQLYPGWQVNHWTADRLARVWLLMHWPAGEETSYISTIENLFKSAEMNELVALYSSLPVLAFAPRWVNRCAEGIRSNIGDVLEAIMYHNPYPAQHLPKPAWNQLVLKAFFTDKDVNRITGLDERANHELAQTLLDYASERRSAHRTINPQLWRLAGPFITPDTLPAIEALFTSTAKHDQYAAVLVCSQSQLPAAAQLLSQYPQLQNEVEEKNITWKSPELHT